MQNEEAVRSIPHSAPRIPQFFLPILATGLALLAGAALAFHSVPFRFDIPENRSPALGEKKVVVLEAKNWFGSLFPLRKHVDIDEDIDQGLWTIILFRMDCERCRKLLDILREAPPQNYAESRMALIELPPFSGEAENLLKGRPHLAYGQLNPEWEWFVESPVIIQVVNGRVRRVFKAGDAGFFGRILAMPCDHCGRRRVIDE
jgi:hypothetical protein